MCTPKWPGYIKKIYVDVGDHVKQGQTLAVLEVPELAAQLTGADAQVRAIEGRDSARAGRCAASGIGARGGAFDVRAIEAGQRTAERTGGAAGSG